MNHNNKWWENFIKDVTKSKQYFITGAFSLTTMLVFGLVAIFVNYSGDFETSTFTDWYESNEMVQTKRTPYRGLASATPEFACLSDGARIENLKKDVQYLESQMDSGKGISGKWRGLELETIPTPQAQFLLDFDKLIGQSGHKKSYPECVDLPCVLNTIYQDKSGLSGYLSYYWYLKTGTMLSMSDKVPGAKAANSQYSNYLFTKEELLNFWKLAKSLPESFLHIPGLKSIHKIPTGHQVSGFNKNECSISLGSGLLLFKESCLSSFNNSFFINVASAMAKQVDLNGEHHQSISLSEDWFKLSQWKYEEYWFEKYQTYAQSWFSETPSSYFLSKSASTHPTRQFVQTLAHMRYNPDALVSLHEDVKSHVSKKFFDHHRYDKEGLLRKYLRVANNVWDKHEKSFWIECLDKHFTVEHIDKVGTKKKSFELMNSKLFSCMDSQIPGFVSQVLTQIKKEEYEGCNFFNLEGYQNQADRFLELLSKNIHKKIYKVHFDLEKWGVQLLIGLKVKKEMDELIDSTSLYVSCYFNEDVEKCFNNKLMNTTHQLVNHHSHMHPDYLKQLVSEVQSQFRYVDVKEVSESKAKKFLFPYYASLRSESEEVWKTCKERSLSKSEKFDFPMSFNGGQYYVHPTLLNCINDNIDDIAMDVLKKPLVIEKDGDEIEFELNRNEKRFAQFFLNKRVHQYFKEFVSDEAEVEQKNMEDFFVKNADSLIETVMNNNSLLDEIYSKAQISDRCVDSLKASYPERYYFHTEAQLTGEYGSKICDKILRDDKVKRTVATAISDEWSKVKKLSIKLYKETYQSIIDDCYDSYSTQLSINYVRNSKLRKECMEDGHHEAVVVVLKKFGEMENSEHFMNKEHFLKKELHSLKEGIINDMRKTDRVISSEN